VNELARYGDWEGDTLIGRNRQGAILTLVERKSLLTLVAPLETRQAAPTAEAMIRLLQSLPPHWRQTLTLDNGIEFRLHEQVSQATGIFYFAHLTPHMNGDEMSILTAFSGSTCPNPPTSETFPRKNSRRSSMS